jgi:hypothetical protein
MLSSGNCNSSNVCEPPLSAPFPSYYGIQMLSVELVNEGPANSYTVNLNYEGWTHHRVRMWCRRSHSG